jgi:hypothetical protein
MSDKVTVAVTITERVKYSTLVTITREQFNEMDKGLSARSGAERRKWEEIVGDLCNRLSDWQDADDLEVEDFRVVNEEA